MSERPPSFSATDLSRLPSCWRIARFDSLFDVQQGKQVSQKNRIGNNQHPFLRTKNVSWGRLDLAELDTMNFSQAEEGRLQLKPGDLLICEGGDIGRTAVWRGEMARCYYQNHLHRARPLTATIDSLFVQYWLWYAFETGRVYFGRGNVTTIPNLSQSQLCGLPVPVPDLCEQQFIAQLLLQVQQAIAFQSRSVRLISELKASLVKQFFQATPGRWALKASEIGPVPDTWEVLKVQDLVDKQIIDKPVDGNHGNIHPKSADFVSAGIPFVMASDLKDGSIDFVNCAYLTKAQADTLQKGFAKEGDVLISHKATIGVTAIVPAVEHYAMLTPQVTYYRVLDQTRLNNRFLKAYFDSPGFQTRFLTVARDGSTRAYIGITRQRDLHVALPPLDEQLQIGQCISLVEKRLSIARKREDALRELFHTLMQDLMTGKCTRVNRAASRSELPAQIVL